jgi:hypothetical protein
MKKCLLSALTLLTVVGCTRGKGDHSTVTFSIPGHTASTSKAHSKADNVAYSVTDSLTLSHVVINATGSGFPPVVRSWDAHDNTMPTSFDISVPRGDNRLLQVLAVYKSSANSAMVFYYGDITKSLSADKETAEIPVYSMGGAQQTISGRISGRYFNSPTGGPTADLAMKFNPGNNKPKMLIERTTMFNGWFSVFALSNVPLEYELQPGPLQTASELLFGGPVHLGMPAFDPAETIGGTSAADADRRVRAAVPYHLRGETSSGGTLSFSGEEAEYYVWGFWGNAAARADSSWSTRVVCREDLTGTLSRVKKYSPDSSTWNSQPGLTLQSLGIGSTLPTEPVLLDQTTNAYGYLPILGGVATCPDSSTLYTDWLRINKAMLDGNGNDNAAGFQPPLRMTATLGTITVSTGDPRVITANLLPGAETAIDEFRLYKKVGVSGSYHLENFECGDLHEGRIAGYVNAGAAVPSNGKITLTSNISAAEAAGGVAAALCPYKAGKPYAQGQTLDPYSFAPTGMTTTPAASRWKLTLSASPYTSGTASVYNNTCVPLTIESVDANEGAAAWPANASITLSGAASDQFYSYQDCISQATFPFMPTVYNGKAVLYYKSVRTGSNPSITLTVTGAGLTAGTTTTDTSDAPGNADYLRALYPTSIKAYTCYPLTFQTVYDSSSSLATNYNGFLSFTLGAAPGGSLFFYSEPSCSSTATTSFSLGGSGNYATTAQMYFMYKSATASAITITATAGGFSNVQSVSIPVGNVTVPAAAHHFAVSAPAVMNANTSCVPVHIELQDSAGNPTPMTAAIAGNGTAGTVLIDNGSLGTFYQYSGCYSSPLSTSISMNVGDSYTDLYFNPTVTGIGSLSAMLSGLSGFTTITVKPEVATQFALVFPGQSWSPGNSYVSGSLTPLWVNSEVLVDVYAIKSSYQLDTNYASPTGTGLVLSAGSSSSLQISPFSPPYIVPPVFTAADAGHIKIRVRPLTALSSWGLYASNFSDTWGGLTMFGSAPYLNAVDLQMVTGVGALFGSAASSTIYTSTCQPFLLETHSQFYFNSVTYTPSATPLLAGGSLDVTGATSLSGNLEIYTDASCTTALTFATPTIATNETARLLYAKPVTPSVANSANLNLATLGSLPSTLQISLNAIAGSASVVDHYEFLAPMGSTTGLCQAMVVTRVDSTGNAVVSGSASVALGANGTGGQFYSTPDCSGSNFGSLSFSSGESAKLFYFRANPGLGAATASITLTASDGSKNGSHSLSLMEYQP